MSNIYFSQKKTILFEHHNNFSLRPLLRHKELKCAPNSSLIAGVPIYASTGSLIDAAKIRNLILEVRSGYTRYNGALLCQLS